MAFHVNDEEVINLADDPPSRTDAIRYALKAQIEVTQSRTGELLDVMTNEIWPLFAGCSAARTSRTEVHHRLLRIPPGRHDYTLTCET
ncbi:hypothetical protein E3G68_005201 [Mycobacteroides abscessus]|uniref:hypothetical protein n=1 Tax=Mycobacteroides abscessus TaxID=36809 RepID=UPI001C6BD344|nr:hypothetical protein [Mycobacteroides abscessus]